MCPSVCRCMSSDRDQIWHTHAESSRTGLHKKYPRVTQGAPKLSVALHGSHLANTQININNSSEMYHGIIRNFCKHIVNVRSEV